MRRLISVGIALLCLPAISGCVYDGLAVTPDGKELYVAKHSLFSARIYKCRTTDGAALTDCRNVTGVP